MPSVTFVNYALGNIQAFAHIYNHLFLHSFCIVPRQPDDVFATAQYGAEFVATIHNCNVCGMQFHPKKSHQWSIDLLRNFVDM
jgi:glutamine amidotransferase